MSISEIYDDNDAVGLAALVKAGEVTPHELLDEALRRIDDRNPAINAVVHRFDDIARQQIDDGIGQSGPLWGVPYLLKDLYSDLAGTPLTNGSRSWAGHVSTQTSYATQRYLDAGLIICGKTNSPEFGLATTTENLLHGPARNPWNTDHTTGGSSGGAGAAVAAGIVPVAHATDGGGSIRIPASCNGLVGLKPTRGRTPTGPPTGEGWAGMSIGHVVSNTVRDSAAVLDATHGVAPGGPYDAPAPKLGTFAAAARRDPGTLRIGWALAGRPRIDIDDDVTESIHAAAAALVDLGHQVEETSLAGLDWDGLADAFGTVVSTGVTQGVRARAAETGAEPSQDILEAMTLLQLDRAKDITSIDYLNAVDTLHALGRQTAALWDSIDVLVVPTVPHAPAELGTLSGPMETAHIWGPKLMATTAFTALFNATGQPGMSLPLHWSEDGLPVGVQIVGRFGDEETLLALAGQLEIAMPWADRRPDRKV